MPLQHIQDATFELPEGLRDKTVHMFALSDTGPSEFNLVLHRAEDVDDASIDAFADRLIRELRKGLAKFDLKERKLCDIDGSPAVELSYTFRQEGVFLHQRQVAVLVRGGTPDRPTALMITGTCPKAFTDRWNETFDSMLGSVKLREPWHKSNGEDTQEKAAPTPAAASGPPPDVPWPVFALCEGMLYVVESYETADPAILPIDVAWGRWKFFDATGKTLDAVARSDDPIKPHAADRFELRPSTQPHNFSLGTLLDSVITLWQNDRFASLSDVQRHLNGTHRS